MPTDRPAWWYEGICPKHGGRFMVSQECLACAAAILEARADAAEKRADEGRRLLERIREHAVGDKPPETDPPRNRLQAIYGLVEAHLAAHPTPESED